MNNNFHVNSWEEEKWKEGGDLTWVQFQRQWLGSAARVFFGWFSLFSLGFHSLFSFFSFFLIFFIYFSFPLTFLYPSTIGWLTHMLLDGLQHTHFQIKITRILSSVFLCIRVPFSLSFFIFFPFLSSYFFFITSQLKLTLLSAQNYFILSLSKSSRLYPIRMYSSFKYYLFHSTLSVV